MATAQTFAAMVPLLLLAACKPPPDARNEMPRASEARGRLAMERVGCGSCHVIPGVWPQGRIGPSLEAFSDQGLIGGRLPNRPEILSGFIRNAPQWLPGTAMPAMPLTEQEARDAAAYLYALGDK